MANTIKYTMLIILFFLLTTFGYGYDQTQFYYKISVNDQGFLTSNYKYKSNLGYYLFYLGNKNVVRAKIREGHIIEYSLGKKNYYIVYKDDGTVKEIGEKSKSGAEISHLYRYNAHGYVKEIEHYVVQDRRRSFKYLRNSKTLFHYNNKNLLIKKEKMTNHSSKKNQVLERIVIQYNQAGNALIKQIYGKRKLTYSLKYQYDHELLKQIKIIDSKKQLIKKILYSYDSKNVLKQIQPIVYHLNYYGNSSKKVLARYSVAEGIANGVLELDNNIIMGVKGLLPNIESYIVYYFTCQPSDKYKKIKKKKVGMLAVFKNHSIEDKTVQNTVKLYLDQEGREIKTEWFNKKGEELFHQLPREIRLTRIFNIENTLNTQHVIFGEILTEKKRRIKNEIIIELYDKNGNRKWCYVSNGFYFYPIRFSDKIKEYSRIRIMKAGYEYKTINFKMTLLDSLIPLTAAYLKLVISKE